MKSYKVIYLEVARLNTREAKSWYKSQKDGLQKQFAASVKDAIFRIQANPEAFAVRYKNIRIAHPYRFPFSIHFYVDDSGKQIVITNIIDDNRAHLD